MIAIARDPARALVWRTFLRYDAEDRSFCECRIIERRELRALLLGRQGRIRRMRMHMARNLHPGVHGGTDTGTSARCGRSRSRRSCCRCTGGCIGDVLHGRASRSRRSRQWQHRRRTGRRHALPVQRQWRRTGLPLRHRHRQMLLLLAHRRVWGICLFDSRNGTEHRAKKSRPVSRENQAPCNTPAARVPRWMQPSPACLCGSCPFPFPPSSLGQGH
jgi:hypothetical protein